MGLLGSLLKKGIDEISDDVASGIGKGISEGISSALGKAVETAVRPAADKLANEAAEDINQAADDLAKGAQASRETRSALSEAFENLAKAVEELDLDKAVQSEDSADPDFFAIDENDTRSAAEKIAAVLAEEFPQYQVKTNVSPTTIGGKGRFLDYSFGIYEGGEPKLFIMLVGKTTCSSRMYRWSKEQAERSGVTLINFIEHYPNKPAYISRRLHLYI